MFPLWLVFATCLELGNCCFGVWCVTVSFNCGCDGVKIMSKMKSETFNFRLSFMSYKHPCWLVPLIWIPNWSVHCRKSLKQSIAIDGPITSSIICDCIETSLSFLLMYCTLLSRISTWAIYWKLNLYSSIQTGQACGCGTRICQCIVLD